MAGSGKNGRRPCVYFVCYGGPRIGFGHVYRCVHLAEALSAKAVATHLFVNPDRRVTRLVARHGLRYSTAPIGRPPAFSSREERPVCVLDYNSFGGSFLRTMHKRATLVNLAPQKLPKWYADINITATAAIDGRRPADANRRAVNFRGPSYAIIAEQFRSVRQRHVRRRVRNVLVCLGGGSYATAASMIVRSFEFVREPLHVRVILGKGVGDARTVRQSARHGRHDVAIHHDTNDMGRQMGDADLAITFPGLTAYECLCVGLPTMLISPSAFHARIAGELEELGCAANAGPLSELRTRALGRRIDALIADMTKRAELHRRAKRTVDGKGLDRAVRVILGAESHA